MPCYHPVEAWQTKEGDRLQWSPSFYPGIKQQRLEIPCGKCLGCVAMRAQTWAIRAVHEAKSHKHNLFLTLTYDDEHLPDGGQLRPRDLTLFFKRVRKAGYNVRYMACGEYGEQTLRPHYHAAVFGWNIPRDSYSLGRGGYTSPTIRLHWTTELRDTRPGGSLGGHSVDRFTPERAHYIAKYSLKADKRNYDNDGVYRQPPYLTASRRPAIGKNWLLKYANDLVYGYLVMNEGHKSAIPRYYKKLLKQSNPELLKQITARVIQNIEDSHTDRYTIDRLEDQERIHTHNTTLDKRTL